MTLNKFKILFLTDTKEWEDHAIQEIKDSSKEQLNDQDSDGHTPLHAAIIAGNVKFAVMLLEYGADPNKIDTKGSTALMIAAKLDHENDPKREIVRILLEKEARCQFDQHFISRFFIYKCYL
jgi:hypothetical protein